MVAAEPAKFKFDAGANGLATLEVAAVLGVVPRAAAAAAIAAAFGSVVDVVVVAAGAAAVAGPDMLNVLRPPGNIVDMSLTPPKKLMFDCGLNGFWFMGYTGCRRSLREPQMGTEIAVFVLPS